MKDFEYKKDKNKDGKKEWERERDHEHNHDHEREHDHEHEHDREREHNHEHEHEHEHNREHEKDKERRRPPMHGQDAEWRDTLPALLMRCGHFVVHNMDGLRGQGRIMHILSERHEISQRELLAELGVKAGTLSEVLARLEERGLIARRQDEGDKRRTIISITETGVGEAEKHSPPSGEEIFTALTDEERETLRNILKKLDDSWLEQIKKAKSREQGEREKCCDMPCEPCGLPDAPETPDVPEDAE